MWCLNELLWESAKNVLCAKLLQSCLTLCDPMNCSPSGSTVHIILQARILEWVAISFSKGSSWTRDWTLVCFVSCMGRRVLNHWSTKEVPASVIFKQHSGEAALSFHTDMFMSPSPKPRHVHTSSFHHIRSHLFCDSMFLGFFLMLW